MMKFNNGILPIDATDPRRACCTPLNRLIINSQEYSNLTHSTAGLFRLDPLGEMPQTTRCTLTRKCLGMGNGDMKMKVSISYEHVHRW